MKYGGNTSCIGVTVGARRLVLDAGTGVRGLGRELDAQGVKEFQLLLTHTHWDHINGFPFFSPAYDPARKIHVMAGHLNDKGGILNVMSTQMENPMFPVPLAAMQADILFEDFMAGEKFDLGDGIVVRTAPLNHPNGATGYRIEYGGRSMVYVTDTEHVVGQLDENILGLIDGADLVIYDSTYTEQEYPNHIGWGHSTWNEGVRLCQAAGVKQLAIFHHEPDHTDDIMDGIAVDSKRAFDNSFIAREGMEVIL